MLTRSPWILALPAVAALALAGCTVTSEEQSAAPTLEPAVQPTTEPIPTPEPTRAPEPTPTEPDCVNEPTGRINMPSYAYNTEPVSAPELSGEISDTGSRESATGEPTLNDDGQVVSYTVQSGDLIQAIGARFCIEPNSLAAYNHRKGWDIYPGDVLVLRPDPDEPWSWEE